MLGIAKGLLGIGAFKQRLPRPEEALPGREHPLPLHNQHYVNSHPLKDGFAGLERIRFAMGCFWGAERKFWTCLLYTSPSPRDRTRSRMPSSA